MAGSLRLADDAVWTRIRRSAAADAQLLELATRVRDAAERWADGQPRSGRHADVAGPHFAVVSEPGRRRARYTVRPVSAFATWLVMQRPADFMACLDAARGA